MTRSISPPEHLDRSVLADIRALGSPDEDVLGEAASLFIGEIPGRLWALVDAIHADSAESVRSIAHRLQESSLDMGTSRMANICLAIEAAASWPALDRAAEHAVELAAVFESTRLALTCELGGDTSGWLRLS